MLKNLFNFNQLQKFESQGVTAVTTTADVFDKCDQIFESLKKGTFISDPEAIQQLAYAIILTIRHTKMPNWRLPHFAALLITILNEMYGYLINVPEYC